MHSWDYSAFPRPFFPLSKSWRELTFSPVEQWKLPLLCRPSPSSLGAFLKSPVRRRVPSRRPPGIRWGLTVATENFAPDRCFSPVEHTAEEQSEPVDFPHLTVVNASLRHELDRVKQTVRGKVLGNDEETPADTRRVLRRIPATCTTIWGEGLPGK